MACGKLVLWFKGNPQLLKKMQETSAARSATEAKEQTKQKTSRFFG